MPTPISSPKLVPRLHQSLGKQRVKILLEIAFISDDSSELAGFPSLFDTNDVITGVWAGAFALMVGADLVMLYVPTVPIVCPYRPYPRRGLGNHSCDFWGVSIHRMVSPKERN